MIGDTYRGDILVTTAVTTQSSYMMRCLVALSVKPPASPTLALPCGLLRALSLRSAPFPSALSCLSATPLPDTSQLSLSVTLPWTSVTRCGCNYNNFITTSSYAFHHLHFKNFIFHDNCFIYNPLMFTQRLYLIFIDLFLLFKFVKCLLFIL